MDDSDDVEWSVEHVYIGDTNTDVEVTITDVGEERKTLENEREQEDKVLVSPLELDEREVELVDNTVDSEAATVEEEKINIPSAPTMDNLAIEHDAIDDATDTAGPVPHIHSFQKQVFDV